MKWITRERPKIDRIACPWLIARFIDKAPEFLYVPTADVMRVAKEQGATPYDVPGVEYTHVGSDCSFDTFIKKHKLAEREGPLSQGELNQGLLDLATIVRGADTDRLDLAPQAAGLLAVSLGLSRLHTDDHVMLAHGMVMYDALYAWCCHGRGETHNWAYPPMPKPAPDWLLNPA
jgi:hypothetical protein